MQRDELAKRFDLRKGGRTLEQLAIGEARFVAKKPPRREREDRVAVERVQGRARVAGAEGVLGGGELKAGLGRDLGRRAGRDGLPADPFAYAAHADRHDHDREPRAEDRQHGLDRPRRQLGSTRRPEDA